MARSTYCADPMQMPRAAAIEGAIESRLHWENVLL